MSRGHLHRHDVAEIVMSDGTLLIGAPTDPDITYWCKVTGQDRLSASVSFGLHHHETPPVQLWRLADRVGLVSHGLRTTDAVLGRVIKDAIDRRRLVAVFLPRVPPPPPLQIVLTRTTTFSKAGGAKFDFARATQAERVTEMFRRTRPLLKAPVSQMLEGMDQSGSISTLGASLAVITSARSEDIVINAALPGFAFAMKQWNGLTSLKEVAEAMTMAGAARHNRELDAAAQHFAIGITELGEPFLTFVSKRSAKRSAPDDEGDDFFQRRTPLQRPSPTWVQRHADEIGEVVTGIGITAAVVAEVASVGAETAALPAEVEGSIAAGAAITEELGAAAEASAVEVTAESAEINSSIHTVGNIKIDDKISPQMEQRGWTDKEIEEIVKTEPAGISIDNTGGRNDAATVYGTPERHLVINDKTKNVVQISGGKGWKWPAPIRWPGFKVSASSVS